MPVTGAVVGNDSASVNSSDTGGNFNHRVSDIDALTAAPPPPNGLPR